MYDDWSIHMGLAEDADYAAGLLRFSGEKI
jgi:hypothetical protein